MGGLVAGRIVYFVFDEQSAAEVNRRRTTGASIAKRIVDEQWPVGAQAHIGNDLRAGDIVPAMVVRVWNADTGCVNLKVMLDGADTYWATSVTHSTDNAPRSWRWMYQGQATRGTAA